VLHFRIHPSTPIPLTYPPPPLEQIIIFYDYLNYAPVAKPEGSRSNKRGLWATEVAALPSAAAVGGMSVQFTKGSSGNSRHFKALGALGKIA